MQGLGPTIAVLRPLRPVIFEGLGTGALVNSPVRLLVGLMQNESLGILQVQHAPFGCRLVRCHQVIQKLAQLRVICHVAAKDKSAVFMDNEESVGPSPVTPMNLAI